VTLAFRSLTEGLGAIIPGGWLLVHVLGSPSQYERTVDGGRRLKLMDRQVTVARQMHASRACLPDHVLSQRMALARTIPAR
jgi:hypothetical protein